MDSLAFRHAAFAWLDERTAGGEKALTRADILEFTFDGQPFRLQSPMQGIWRPKQFGAALSIQTVFRAPGQARPYEDVVGSDGLIRYKWKGDNPADADNVALRRAMEFKLPIIWFVGVAMSPARFQVVAPVYIVGEEREQQQFVLAPSDQPAVLDSILEGTTIEETAKRYLYSMTKRRLHQPVFRSTVLAAYRNHCTVCNLAHPRLLDAAHIVPDRDELGVASVQNGMAMCKIHHAAFDSYFMGVRPDSVVEIRKDLLEEIDGPMLRHGLQDLHGKKLMFIPERKAERPRTDLLEIAYEKFRTATVDDAA